MSRGASYVVKPTPLPAVRSAAVTSGLLLLGCLAFFIYGMQRHCIYFASLMLVFFMPSCGLGYYVWTRGDRWYRRAITLILALSFVFSVVIEVTAVRLKFWTFFTDIDPLLGINIGAVPIEEYIFYFGANMQLCLLYAAGRLKCERQGLTAQRFWSWLHKEQAAGQLPDDATLKRLLAVVLAVGALVIGIGLLRRFRKEAGRTVERTEERDSRGCPVYIEGKWYPGWLIAIAPFAIGGLLWLKSVVRLIHVPALLISFAINMTMYLFFEYNAIMRGHWVYNAQRLIGWRVFDTIPFEEICLYCTSFLFLVPFFETARYLLIRYFGSPQELLAADAPAGVSLAQIREFVGKTLAKPTDGATVAG